MDPAITNNGEHENGHSTAPLPKNGSPAGSDQNGQSQQETAGIGNHNSVLLRLYNRGHVGLEMLCEAAIFAQDVQHNRWDFSLEISLLRETGLVDSDLRWLMCKGLLEHGMEVKSPGSKARHFHPTNSLAFTRTSCFVLSEAGQSYFGQELMKRMPPTGESALAQRASLLPTPEAKSVVMQPCWDRDRQELRVGSQVVKQFKVPAPNQEIILAVFQEENWPASIDDPLPPHRDLDPKRRLQDTIASLNRNHKTQLLRFLGNGSGQAVCWEFVQQTP